jgi:hypothetical protein
MKVESFVSSETYAFDDMANVAASTLFSTLACADPLCGVDRNIMPQTADSISAKPTSDLPIT